MKLTLAILACVLSFSASATLQTLRIVEFATISSLNCYSNEDEQQINSISSVSIYVGGYSDSGEGKVFNYYVNSEELYSSSQVCKAIKLIEKSLDDSLPYEDKIFKLYVDADDFITGFMSPNSDKLVYFENN